MSFAVFSAIGYPYKANKLQTAPLKSETLGFSGVNPKAEHRNDQDVIVLSSDEDELEDDVDRKCENSDPDSDGRLPIGLPPLGRNVPLSRRMQLSPPKLDVLPDLDVTTIFNRHHLNTYLGGGLIALQVRIGAGKQKSVARRFGITSFMCPNLDHNPWAPCHPGQVSSWLGVIYDHRINIIVIQDGYIFVGLGNEKDAFKSEETHELFIQFAPKKMFYAGRYSFQKVEDLTVDEWKCLLAKASLVIPRS
ncbi:hypothetical protein JB92DRAFT_2955812 [Gautieria morchelliformis]|nr:hypothetical protein JB92DRAFT_2955812 [Gautieria morchelliformis]